MGSTNQKPTSFWDQVDPGRLDDYLKGKVAAYDTAEAAKARATAPPTPKVKRPWPTAQVAQPPIPAAEWVQPPAQVTQPPIPDVGQPQPMGLYCRVKRAVVRSSLLMLTGAALAVLVPRWLSLNGSNRSGVIRVAGYEAAADPQPSKTDQEPVAPKSNKTEREVVTGSEPSKPAPEAITYPRLRGVVPKEVTNPEPSKPAPEVLTSSEPAEVDTSEPVVDRIRKPSGGVFLDWAAAGDPDTLYKKGEGTIDCRAERCVGDRIGIAQAIREAKANIVKGTVMWAEQQPDGAIDVHTYVNVRENVFGDETAFKLRSPFTQCRRLHPFGMPGRVGKFIPAEELQLPREMWYRNGSSLTQH
jgi:hypothetical protein